MGERAGPPATRGATREPEKAPEEAEVPESEGGASRGPGTRAGEGAEAVLRCRRAANPRCHPAQPARPRATFTCVERGARTQELFPPQGKRGTEDAASDLGASRLSALAAM